MLCRASPHDQHPSPMVAAGDLGQRGATARRNWSLPDRAPTTPGPPPSPLPSPSRNPTATPSIDACPRAARSGATGMILAAPSTLDRAWPPGAPTGWTSSPEAPARPCCTGRTTARNGTRLRISAPAIVGGPGSRGARAGPARHLRSRCRQPALAEILERRVDGLLSAGRLPHLEPRRGFVGAESAGRLRPGQRQRACTTSRGTVSPGARTSGSAATWRVLLPPSREGRT